MSPADELLAAATKVRDTAKAATPGPWEIRPGNDVSANVAGRQDLVIDGGGWTDGTKAVVFGAALTADAAWIALANPAIAEPLADLIYCPCARHAAAAARAINGSGS